MSEIIPRDRVLTALNGGIPDRVPFVDNAVDEALQIQLMGRTDYTPADLCRKLGMDGFGATFPIVDHSFRRRQSDETDGPKEAHYYPETVTFDFFNPYFTEYKYNETTNRSFASGERMLTSNESLKVFDELHPDPEHPERYERVAKWLDQYRKDYAVFARLDLGAGPTLQSMGLNNFSYALVDNPKLIHEIHSRFSEWAKCVIRHLNEMDFDFLWIMDDLAANDRPFMPPDVFREYFLPHMKIAAEEIKKPWVFHSDGNILPFFDDLLSLGMNAIHPLQQGPMDIEKVKETYGDKVCLVGNIDLNYTLTRGTPDEVDKEVKERIKKIGQNGAYIISSAMTLTDYCKEENVMAMAKAVKHYGKYPINI